MNRRHRKKRPLRTAVLTLFLTGGVVAAGAVIWQQVKPETSIGAPPPAKVSTVLGTQSKSIPVSAGPLGFELPRGWEPFKNPSLPDHVLSWRNTEGAKGTQSINIYLRDIPAGMRVNRVLAVELSAGKLIAKGGVSENCTKFVDATTQAVAAGSQSARWEGVPFVCDIGNYTRNLVGVSSSEGPNHVKLEGPSGSHVFFVTYNDTDVSPDFEPLMHAVGTMVAK